MERLSDKVKARQRTRDWSDDEGTFADTTPANPTDYVAHLQLLLERAAGLGIRCLFIVLYCRVSSSKQSRNGSLAHQWPYVRRRVQQLSEKYGIRIEVIGEFDEDVSGTKLLKSKRLELVKAARLAKRRDAILVALNTSKFVRNEHYWPQRKAMPTVDDFERLKELVGNVQLATIIHPDQHEDGGGDTIRGLKASDAKLGRPPSASGHKKRRRMRFKLLIIRAVKQGLGNREIGRQLGVHESTVRKWKLRYRKYWVRQIFSV